jgi:aspartate racemase
MKTIGLLGGATWSSTIGYYQALNEQVNERLGGYHSAKILLKSIDYHDIKTNYAKDDEKVASLLKSELEGLLSLKPDCFMICCNILHKYYDLICADLNHNIPLMFHAVDLVASHLKSHDLKKTLLLATKFTMEDGFFAKKLEKNGIHVVIPNEQERENMRAIHEKLAKNKIDEPSREYFRQLILGYRDVDCVVLGCTEYGLLVNQQEFELPIIDSADLQVRAAINFALSN